MGQRLVGIRYSPMTAIARKSGEAFRDSLAKFRGLQELCQSLGVRVGPVLLNRASTKVLFLEQDSGGQGCAEMKDQMGG